MYPEAVKIDPVGEFIELNSENAWNYLRASSRRGCLITEVISPFEEQLKISTGWNDEKIPKKLKKTPYKFNEVEFLVTTTPTTKRPGYSEIYEDVVAYLNFIMKECKKGATIKNVKAVKGKPLILVEALIELAQEKAEEIIKEGVEQKIVYSESERLWEEKPSGLLVPTRRNPKELDNNNSTLYVRADKLSDYFRDKVISPFETALKSLTGWGKEIPEETQEYWEQLGEHIFHVQSIPYPSTRYAAVISCLLQENKDHEKSGDLVKILNDTGGKLIAKYSVKIIGQEKYVSVKNTLKAIEAIKKEKTKIQVKQPITYYPLI